MRGGKEVSVFPKIGSKIDEIRIDGNLNFFRRDLDCYAGLGLEAVEIPVHGLDLIQNGCLNEKRLKRVLEILRDFSFEYSVHSPNPLNLMDQWASELHVSVFRASLEFTRAIGSKILVYHAGRFIPEESFPISNNHGISKDEALRLMETERQSLTQLAEQYPDIIICIENARPYLFYSPYCYSERIDILQEQVEAINLSNVRINLDTGHLNMAAHFYQFDPVAAVDRVHGLIAHTHLHDNFGGTIYPHEKIQTHQIPFGRGDAHMPVGWGNIPLAEVLAAYLPSYRGMLMMELRSRYFDHVKESKENLVFLIQSLTEIDRPIDRYSQTL